MPSTALDAARRVVGRPPAGLVADLDGTLAPIAPRPQDARPAPGAIDALRALAERLEVVAVVTGRAALDARAVLGDEAPWVVGNHGLEWLAPRTATPRLPSALEHALAAVPALIDQAFAAVAGALGERDGVLYEHKRLSGTVHYRLAADPARTRGLILSALGEALRRDPAAGEALEVREGKMAVELRPRGAGDKGSAVRALVREHALRGLLVFGDDVTDVDAFRAAAALRADGTLDAFIGAVGGSETPPDVLEAADALLPSPDALVELLGALV